MNIRIVNPFQYANWNREISELSGASIFHASNWANVLTNSYGYEPRYFIALKEKRIAGCIPIMGINSRVTGKRGVSVPFADECKPLGDCNSIKEIWKAVVQYAEKKCWKSVELRGSSAICESTSVNAGYKIHTINLKTTETNLHNRLRSSTRRNIQKAIKNKVVIHHEQSLKALHTFYQLHCVTRKKHGLPPQPIGFMNEIYKHILSVGKGYILTAVHNGAPIASAIYFVFNGVALYKYGASDMAHQALRANNLITWCAIKKSIREGLYCFHFGRTDPANTGLLQYKRGWGAIEENLDYYKYELKKMEFIKGRNTSKAYYSLFRLMPLPTLKLIGRILYKHIG